MQIPVTLLVAISLLFGEVAAFAAPESRPIHHSADKEYWDRKTNRVELVGHATVRQPGETLTADHIFLDLNLRTLDAKGNCVYTSTEALMFGEEMHFNLDTRTGTIVGGRVSNDKFTLAGERINKLGAGRFQTHWGEYTTCRDCTASWSLLSEDVDLEFDGYAFMSNVTAKVKDASALWLPYLIVPVKSRRQTGVLFPTIRTGGENGFSFVLPFFWAINDSADMTIGLGAYTAKGFRAEWEGRYALSSRSGGAANFFYIDDKTFGSAGGTKSATSENPSGNPSRWAIRVGQVQELPLGIDEKLKVTEVSDNSYPVKYPADVPESNEPFLASSLSFSHSSDDFSAFVQGTRIRNMLYTSPQDGLRAFDPNTVQVYPSIGLSSNDRGLWGTPFYGGLSMEAANFTRIAGPTSHDLLDPKGPDTPANSIDLIREASRVSITPSLYTTFRPFDSLSVVPSAQYRTYYYAFGKDQAHDYSNLFRSYLLLQVDASLQLERIFDTDDPNYPRRKHLIRPLLTFSWIPDYTIRDDERHPFNQQIAQMSAGAGRSGYTFDDNDIIPRDNSPSDVNYFVPLGKSIAYGFTTQLIQRNGADDSPNPSYLTLLEWSAGQAFNFRQYDCTPQNCPRNGQTEPDYPQPLSRFFSSLTMNWNGKLTNDTTYYYYPYTPKPRNKITTSMTYIFERATHQRVLTYDRSFSLTYALDKFACNTPDACTENLQGALTFSLNDYILPSASASYTWIGEPRWLGAAAGLKFQSPSQCWRFGLDANYSFPNQGFTVSVDFSLNLTGTGFGGISEVATQAMSH